MYEVISADFLMVLMALINRLDSKALLEPTRELKRQVLMSIFQSQKSKIEFMGNLELATMAKVADSLGVVDKKFCAAFISIISKRIRQLPTSTVGTILRVTSRLDAPSLTEIKANVLQVFAQLIDAKLFSRPVFKGLAQMLQGVLMLDSKGLFAGSRVLKDHLISEIITAARKRVEATLAEKGPASRDYTSAVAELAQILDIMSETVLSDFLKTFMTDFLLRMPETIKYKNMTFTRAKMLLSLMEDYNKKVTAGKDSGSEVVQAKFRIGELKRSLISLSKRLNFAIKKASAPEAIEMFELIQRLHETEQIPTSGDLKKIVVNKFVADCYEFTPEELTKWFQYLIEKIPNAEEIVLKQIEEVCFNEYSQSVQIEYQFRKHMNTKYQAEYEWPERKYLVPGYFKRYRDIAEQDIEVKPLIKISTMATNCLLLLSLTSAKHLVKDRATLINRNHCTSESLSIIDKLSV